MKNSRRKIIYMSNFEISFADTHNYPSQFV